MTFLDSLLDYFRNAYNVYIAILDIVLVAYLIYRLLLLVRGTRAVQLLKGLAIIFALVWVTKPLPTLNWLVRQAMLPGIIAIVIIFQPELRMALERLGRGRLLGGRMSFLPPQDKATVVNQVVDAVDQMSRERVGALIAIERQTGLIDICRTGKPVGGKVSPELLRSLFFPNSPLHDGAVVICGDEIVAAGCVLPHSEAPSLPVGIGMRHRAALGLTERTDAVAIVVSEETGRVSLAVGGALTPAPERPQLANRLMELLSPPVPRPFSWRRPGDEASPPQGADLPP